MPTTPLRSALAALILATVAALPLSAADPDADTFAKSMKYTQDIVAKQHLIALVEINPFEGGKKQEFRYDHYPTVERLQTEGVTYARKKGAAWLKSDDYAETGKKVKADKAQELDALVGFVDAPLYNRTISKDKTQGANVVQFIKREKDGDSERIFYEIRRENSTGMAYPQFVFSPWRVGNDEDAMLIGYGGLMRTGDVRVKVNINYQYMFLVNAVIKNAEDIPKPDPAEGGTPKPAGAPTTSGLPKPANENAADAAEEDPDKIYDFFALQKNKAALSGKVVRLEVSTGNAIGKDLGNGQMHAMLHDVAKPGFIGFVDFPKGPYKSLGFSTALSKQTVILLVRVNTTDNHEPATFTALGRKAVKGKDGEPGYEW